MATSDDLEAWATTEGYGIDWCESQGLGVQCDDVEIREEFGLSKPCMRQPENGVASDGQPERRGYNFAEAVTGNPARSPQAFPASTPVQEEGVAVLPAGSHSHSLNELCEECGHDVRLHGDQYGCQYERGDRWVDGESMGAWVAAGPCGCKEVPAPGGQDSTRDRREQPAEGVRLPSTAQTVHHNTQHGRQSDEAGGGQGIAPCSSGVGPQTACDWLRNIGVFLDCGDL